MDKDFKNRAIELVKELRNESGKSQEQVASDMSIERDRYAQYERRTALPQQYYQNFAKSVGVDFVDFIARLHQQSALKAMSNNSLQGVPVIGEVQAGIWKEALEWHEDDRINIPYGVPERYIGKAYGLLIRGQSMNLVYPENTVVVCIPLYEFVGALESGKRVIVERTLHNGIVEATAKELEVVNGTALLKPRSTEKKYQEPIEINWPYETPQECGLEKVEIKAVIIGMYREE